MWPGIRCSLTLHNQDRPDSLHSKGEHAGPRGPCCRLQRIDAQAPEIWRAPEEVGHRIELADMAPVTVDEEKSGDLRSED